LKYRLPSFEQAFERSQRGSAARHSLGAFPAMPVHHEAILVTPTLLG
jgi:hypothetical protein